MNALGTVHLSESQVSDLADGTLDPREEPAALAHIGRCDPCNRDVAETRALLALSRKAHTDIAAPPELWPLIASATIHAGRGVGRRAARLTRLLLVIAFAMLIVGLALSMRARLRARGPSAAGAGASTGDAVRSPPATQAPHTPAPNGDATR